MPWRVARGFTKILKSIAQGSGFEEKWHCRLVLYFGFERTQKRNEEQQCHKVNLRSVSVR